MFCSFVGVCRDLLIVGQGLVHVFCVRIDPVSNVFLDLSLLLGEGVAHVDYGRGSHFWLWPSR